MTDKFETQIDTFVANTEKKILGVMKESIKELVIATQTPVSKGGKMRVDTGFLRWSGVAALNALPRGLSKGKERPKGSVGVLPEYKYDENDTNLNMVLLKMKIGDVFYFGWTARYAKYREAYDGFLETNLQNWQTFVDASVKKMRERSK